MQERISTESGLIIVTVELRDDGTVEGELMREGSEKLAGRVRMEVLWKKKKMMQSQVLPPEWWTVTVLDEDVEM